ncbi:hypothetical protein BDA99DRAFT_291385 [Phascolomyces articulosus]|uniref:Mid2 domain-containing protein n=1 Tax=Phascolomyces articulosus TaxID=60185 RepID=A0AAD5JX99_9FUNG|nr:hypothetical protein BDA99DRAFT_291385 [Phascolomyces articulosus]
MVNDAILTAQFVQTLPMLISKSLGVTADDVIVVSITTAGNDEKQSKQQRRRRRKRETLDQDKENSGVLVSMAIPKDNVEELQTLVETPSSALYDASNGQLAMLIDTNYFVASTTNTNNNNNNNNGDQDSTDSASEQATPSDPNQVENQEAGQDQGKETGSGLSTGAIVGIAVSCGVVVYAIGTVLFVRRYRKRRQQRQEEEAAQHQVFAQSISAPIMQENSLGWTSSPPPLQPFPPEQQHYNAHGFPHHAHSQW